MRFPVLIFVLLAACSRPLTPTEEKFASDLFGDSLDTSDIRIAQGLGVTPLYKTVPKAQATVVQGTDKACIRTPSPTRSANPPQAFAFKNRLHFGTGLYSTDMTLAWPRYLRFPQAIILAHELTHAWQWQHRARTGYTPWRAAKESVLKVDPYFSNAEDAPTFLMFGYEQQAAIVEDYVCFAVANPTHPRRYELREILDPVLPMDRFDAAIGG
ncbi:unnamed protein product [Ectocarpus sp. 12 AP-2014]